jgi:hypothetical protein
MLFVGENIGSLNGSSFIFSQLFGIFIFSFSRFIAQKNCP